MQFIPTTINACAPFGKLFLTSISQYEKQSASMAHPPLANTNEAVAIFLIIGVIFIQSSEKPRNKATSPAISIN